MLFTLIAFALALGILVTFHELGHYWVARACGVRVLRFSLGFGRVIARRTDRNGTEWALSLIPLGGYVKMQDDPPPGAPAQEVARSFNAKPVSQRIAIVAAGPFFNLALAALLYASLNLAGTQEPEAVVAAPAAGTPAATAGFQAGERIEKIDGKDVRSWSDARWKLLDVLSGGGRALVEVRGVDGAQASREFVVPPSNMDPSATDPLADAGLRLQAGPPVVRGVIAGGAGEAAGLQEGDRIVGADALQDPTTRSLIAAIQASDGKPLRLDVQRGDARIAIPVTPTLEDDGQGGRVGRIAVQLGADVPMVEVRYGLGESLALGVTRTVDTAWFSLKMMGRMLTGDVSWRNVSGPVTIADYAGQTARIGLGAYVAFLALVSVSLGVLNLLPIPMLDGGHLLYYFVEIIKGSPPSTRWLELGQRAGFAILAGLMSLALFNDVVRLFT
ncbi:Membrane-associated zinc metalloprotease [plant metagenome]|uniref:Membrane-associated zinc metalloprotease n=1 Tax=plant metagenome TaxID=1297885 RepID=A0A484RDP4_9ZZZZ